MTSRALFLPALIPNHTPMYPTLGENQGSVLSTQQPFLFLPFGSQGSTLPRAHHSRHLTPSHLLLLEMSQACGQLFPQTRLPLCTSHVPSIP